MRNLPEKLLSPCDGCSSCCDADCKDLTLESLDLQTTIGGISPIKPDFTPLNTNYLVYVQSDIDNISIAPAVSSSVDSSITVNNSPVESGVANNYSLEVGNNVFEIVVTSKTNSSMSYLLLVVREDIKPTTDKFQKLTYTDPKTDVTLAYNLFVPDNYDSNKSYPLVLFMHGLGERGNDCLSVLTANQGATIWAKESEQTKHPCFVLAPQCPAEKRWTIHLPEGYDEPTDELGAVYNLVQQTISQYNIDNNRLYCTGLSMGGFGSWMLNILHPNLFAAVVPVCAYGGTTLVSKLVKKPIWVFTAEEDPRVSVDKIRETVNALIASGGDLKYTEYPAGSYFYPMAHYSWVPAYANEEMREWLFSQKLN